MNCTHAPAAKKLLSLCLAALLLLPFLASCSEAENTTGDLSGNLVQNYTVEETILATFEGLTISVIAGEYASHPECRVTNTSDTEYRVVVDAVLNDQCQQPSSILSGGIRPGWIYTIPAGADQKLSECQTTSPGKFANSNLSFVISGNILGSSAITFESGMLSSEYKTDIYDYSDSQLTINSDKIYIAGIAGSGGSGGALSILQSGTTKREYRISVYSAAPSTDAESVPLPTAEELLYRTELILLKTSIYDENLSFASPIISNPLMQRDGVCIGASWNISKVVQKKPEDTSEKDALTAQTIIKKVSFTVQNTSEHNLHIEFVLSRDEAAAQDEQSAEEPDSYEMFTDVFAGKYASWSVNKNGDSAPSWIGAHGAKLTIRVYKESDGSLLLEESDLTLTPPEDSEFSDNGILDNMTQGSTSADKNNSSNAGEGKNEGKNEGKDEANNADHKPAEDTTAGVSQKPADKSDAKAEDKPADDNPSQAEDKVIDKTEAKAEAKQ